jgi:hypothetical protein
MSLDLLKIRQHCRGFVQTNGNTSFISRIACNSFWLAYIRRHSGAEQSAYPFQVFRCVDAGAGRVLGDVNCNPVAVPHGAQLFQ